MSTIQFSQNIPENYVCPICQQHDYDSKYVEQEHDYDSKYVEHTQKQGNLHPIHLKCISIWADNQPEKADADCVSCRQPMSKRSIKRSIKWGPLDSNWGDLNRYLYGSITSKKENLQDTIRDSMREWLLLRNKDIIEYKNRLNAIYKLIIPIGMGPDSPCSACATRDIKAFEVLGPYSDRVVDESNSENELSWINERDFDWINPAQLGYNNISVVIFDENIDFYVANRNINKGEELLVDNV